MKATLITLLSALAATGCVTIPISTTPITTESGNPVPVERIYQRGLTVSSPGHTAKVSFLRDAGVLGSNCTHKILVDGQVAFAIRGGEYQTLYLAPGRYLLGLEIEGGVCPALSLGHQADLSDKAEETYRILIPSLGEGPTVLGIDTTGRPIGRFAYVSQTAGPSASNGPIGAAPPLSAQRPQPVGAGWRINFNESGSNPVVADGVLYVGSADGAVHALDPKTGETNWRFQTGEGLASGPQVITVPRGTSTADQIERGINAAERQAGAGVRRVDMTPAVESGTVFIGSGDQSFYAIDAATGKEKWSCVAGPGMASPNFSIITQAAAILRNGTVYFATEDGLHALDALTGKRKWLFETLQEIPKQKYMPKKRPPVGLVMEDGMIVLTAWPFIQGNTPLKSFVYGVDPESGTAKWVVSVDGLDITAPRVVKGLAFFAVEEKATITSHTDRVTLYAINAADGHVKWKFSAERKFRTRALLVVDKTIYLSTEPSLVAVDLETGRQLWSFDADEIAPSLQADDRHLYVVTHKGTMARPDDTLHALALNTGHEKWSRRLSGNVRVAMVHDGVVYVGGAAVYAIDVTTGKELWSFKGTGRESARLISGGRIFLMSATVTYFGTTRVDQGYLYAIDAKAGDLESH